MRVHLRNVVYSALERGLVVGHHRVNKLPKLEQKNMDTVVYTMMKSLWESLDGIIDFRDDDSKEEDGESRAKIGFQSADAIADTILEVEEDEDDIVPLDVLHRIQRVNRHRKS